MNMGLGVALQGYGRALPGTLPFFISSLCLFLFPLNYEDRMGDGHLRPPCREVLPRRRRLRGRQGP